MSVETVVANINQLLPEPHAGLLAGILFGVKSTMPKDFYNDLVTTGTLHIVALSGANISILSSLISSTLLGSFHFSKRNTGVLTICIIIGFVLFVGAEPSIVRAAIMGTLTAISILAGRQSWPLWSFFITVCVMIAFSPSIVSNISFQLSAGATLGILLFGRQIRSKSIFLPLINSVRLTLCAQVFTVPIILFHFHRVSLISPLPNVLIGWVIAPLTGWGYVMSLVSPLAKPVAQIMAWIAWVPLEYVIRVVTITARIPLASVSI